MKRSNICKWPGHENACCTSPRIRVQISSAHIKSQASWYMAITPPQGRQSQEDPRGLLVRPPSQIMKPCLVKIRWRVMEKEAVHPLASMYIHKHTTYACSCTQGPWVQGLHQGSDSKDMRKFSDLCSEDKEAEFWVGLRRKAGQDLSWA